MGIVADRDDERPLIDYIEEAMAASIARQADPAFQALLSHKPAQAPKKKKRNFDDPDDLTVEKAFAWLDQADAYLRDRLQDPAINAAELKQMWDDLYQYRYSTRKHPFPAERLAKASLTRGQWHDVFQKTKDYVAPGETYDKDGVGGGSCAPHELIESLAKKFGKNKDHNQWRRNKAVIFLNNMHIFVGHMSMSQRAEVKQRIIDAHKYPRTYL